MNWSCPGAIPNFGAPFVRHSKLQVQTPDPSTLQALQGVEDADIMDCSGSAQRREQFKGFELRLQVAKQCTTETGFAGFALRQPLK